MSSLDSELEWKRSRLDVLQQDVSHTEQLVRGLQLDAKATELQLKIKDKMSNTNSNSSNNESNISLALTEPLNQTRAAATPTKRVAAASNGNGVVNGNGHVGAGLFDLSERDLSVLRSPSKPASTRTSPARVSIPAVTQGIRQDEEEDSFSASQLTGADLNKSAGLYSNFDDSGLDDDY